MYTAIFTFCEDFSTQGHVRWNSPGAGLSLIPVLTLCYLEGTHRISVGQGEADYWDPLHLSGKYNQTEMRDWPPTGDLNLISLWSLTL